jgi:hypothetical protein
MAFYLAGLFFTALAPRAQAMQFEQIHVSASEVIIGGRGEIIEGDQHRLDQALAAVPAGQTLLSLAIDSPGGSVMEGEAMSRTIQSRGLKVLIPSNSKCVSACFLLFAASPHRLAAADALIGVHSANEGGQETGNSLAITTLMARRASELGIPSAIIGKMVQTTPGRVEWLTHEDLLSMDVVVFNGDAVSASRGAGGATASLRPAAPEAARAPAAPTVPPSAFETGRSDRATWDTWLGSLRGGLRDGALYARAQMMQHQTASCARPDKLGQPDFQQGCQELQRRTAQADARKRASADYTAGWNSVDHVAAPTQAVEAEYQGAYFCGPLVARVTLSVFPHSPGAPRRALFSFTPQSGSGTAGRGAFVVQGTIDLSGGVLQVSPVQWVSQPAVGRWLGLAGRSDDGGRTFSGRVVDADGCSVFTLKRSGGR